MNPTSFAIVTAYQNDYFFGFVSLINSAYHSGYTGDIIVYVNHIGSQERSIATTFQKLDINIVFRTDNAVHFALIKPNLASTLLVEDGYDKVFYFDPDIVIVAPFSFFSRWSEFGVSLVEETQFLGMQDDHPIRQMWLDWARCKGFRVSRPGRQYFNSGFFSVTPRDLEWLQTWKDIIQRLEEDGIASAGVDRRRHNPFATWDQDAMNLALSIVDSKLSTMGPDGMGFTGTGIALLHATGRKKPWRKRFILEALKGNPPTLADKGWFDFCANPFPALTKLQSVIKTIDLKIASAIGRFIRRS